MNRTRCRKVTFEQLERRYLLATLSDYEVSGFIEGKLLTDFSTDGSVVDNGVVDMALQGDKLVAVGFAPFADTGGAFDWGIARYLPNGVLDHTFGDQGRVRMDLTGAMDRASGVLVQPDNKIVVVGYAGNTVGTADFALVRFEENGALDESFGNGGIVIDDLGGHELVWGAVLTDDGDIIVSGPSGYGRDNHVVLTKYDGRTGQRDTLFGGTGDGIVHEWRVTSGGTLAIDSVGRILVGGHWTVMRYTSDGFPDPGFGIDGIATTGFGTPYEYTEAVATDPNDDSVILFGIANTGPTQSQSDFDVALAKFDSAGDLVFAVTAIGKPSEGGGGVLVQPDGYILAVACEDGDVAEDMTVYRFTPAGAPDVSFGNNGVLLIDDFAGGDDNATELVLDTVQDRILVGGLAVNTVEGTGFDFAIAEIPAMPFSVTLRDTLTLPPGYSEVFGISDLDGDDAIDVVATAGNTTTVFEEEGGTLIDRFSTTMSPRRATMVADVDQDGRKEILVADYSSIWVYEATGDNSYDLVHSSGGYGPYIEGGVKVGDSNGNGLDEFLIPQESFPSLLHIIEASSNNVYSYLGAVTGGGGNANAVGVADLDRDGFPEIALSDDAGGTRHTYVYENGTLIYQDDNLTGVEIGETDGNGHDEIIGRDPVTGNLVTFEALGDNTFQQTLNVEHPPISFDGDYIQDVDGDGILEFVGVERGSAGFLNVLVINARDGLGLTEIWNSGDLFQSADLNISSILAGSDRAGQPIFGVLQGDQLYLLGVNVEPNLPDIRIDAVSANGTTGLSITYEIVGADTPSFDVAFFLSGNSVVDASDVPQSTITIGEPLDLTIGQHTKAFTIGVGVGKIALPGAGLGEVADDYYLLAVADPTDSIPESDAEPFSEDNTAALTGAYLGVGKVVFAHGTHAADSIAVAPGLSLLINSDAFSYSAKAVTEFRIRAHGGNDTISAAGVAKLMSIWGGEEDDILTGGTKSDALYGGDGIDELLTSDTNLWLFDWQLLSTRIGTDSLSSIEKAQLIGNGGANRLDAMNFSGPTILEGLGGKDTLLGGNGSDILVGGSGNDAYIFGNSVVQQMDLIQEESAGGIDTLDFSLLGADELVTIDLSDPAAIATHGQVGNSRIIQTSPGSELHLERALGGAGDDIIGGNVASNLLIGNSGADVIDGKGGNDSLEGGAGSDELSGGDGNDTYVFRMTGDSEVDTLHEGSGAGSGSLDLLDFSSLDSATPVVINLTIGPVIGTHLNRTIAVGTGEAANFENITGGAGPDRLVGNGAKNRLNGNAGSDSLSGLGGNDMLVGGSGDDTYVFDADTQLGTDTVNESGDDIADTVDFSETDTRIIVINIGLTSTQLINPNLKLKLVSGSTIENVFGGALADQITGNDRDNTLIGRAGNDVLQGLSGGDALLGEAGNDTLYGDEGTDLLNGGDGTNTYFHGETDGRRVLYLAFDGVSLEYQDLVQFAKGFPDIDGNPTYQWDPRSIDMNRNGIDVEAFQPIFDRENVIAQIMWLVYEDMRAFGITVQRINAGKESLVTGEGATTVFVGHTDTADISGAEGKNGGAVTVDFGNDNFTDFGFVWGLIGEIAREEAQYTANAIAHEAGHTYGLYHVKSKGTFEVMTSLALPETENFTFENQWFALSEPDDDTPTEQNSYDVMIKLFM